MADTGLLEEDPPMAAEETEAEAEAEAGVDLELGDTVYLRGGRLDKTQGILYGFSDDRFTVMPTGASDRVISVGLVDGTPDPELGLEEVIILKKAAKPGFIPLLDLRAGQRVETFSSGGVPSTVYSVKEVNEARDSAIFADEAGEEEELIFGFKGIPRGLPFEVMRARDATPPVQGVQEEAEAPVSRLVVDDEDLADALPEDAEGDSAVEQETFTLGDAVEIEVTEEIKEISTANRIYPDVFQRSEMLSQLIRLLPEAQQRVPAKLQGVRRLVERMMYLRNQAVNYGVAGEPRGEKATSVDTLADLASRIPPLARSVVSMKKVIYHSHREDKAADPEGGGIEEDELVGVYMSDVIDSVETLKKNYVEGGEGVALTAVPGAIPVFYTHMETARKLDTAFRMTTGAASASTTDREVFRLEPPGGEGVPSLGSDDVSFAPIFTTTTPFSLVRILKERVGGGSKNPRQVEPAETPEIISTLLFPRSTARDLGPVRSGSLALDISHGMSHSTLMSDWIDILGEVSDFPTADGILLLGLNGIVGNISVKEWLESQPLVLNSVAEAHALFSAYGFSDLEWTAEQAATLQAKVDANLAGIRIFLARTREEAAAGAGKEPVAAGLLPEARAAELLARVESEPLLQKAIETLRRGLGATAASSDIAWFSALATTTPDLLLAVLGQQPIPLVRERLRQVLKKRTEAGEDGYKLRLKLATAGEPPVRNSCVHVAALEKIRGVKEDSDRTKLLAKFLGKYRSKTEDNWVFCNVCDSHLICGHELLQIQQFVRPKEREALYKEMILNFSAGTEGRSYVCRVCGQSLKEIEYDTGLEFDDEGRPMMGRSAMIDKDAIAEQEIEDLLSGPAKAEEEQTFASEEEGRLYRVIKRIAGLVGIAPEPADYKRILREVSGYTSTLLTREAYAAETRARGGRAPPDYDIYRSLRIVSAATAAVLLDIQTHVPEYTIYFTSADCVGGFGGWPLVATDAPLAGAGIQCVSTVVAGINDDEEPWNLTTLQRQPNLLKRREALEKYVKGQVDMFLKSPTTAAAFVRKREWMEKTGAGVRAKDQLRATFRPVPYKVSVAEAAAAPIAAVGATPRKAAEAWIRDAHGLASGASATGVKGCCFKSLAAPAEAWKGLPALSDVASRATGSMRAVTTFEAGLAKPLDAKTDPDAYWRLFARLCWRGESKGRPHQLGIGLTCGECGLNFVENPNLTSAIEVVGAEEASKAATQLVQHMEAQGVVITEQTFVDLLDAAHRAAAAPPTAAPASPRLEFLAGVGPLDNWPMLLQELQASLAELSRRETATTLQIATAADRFVRAITEKEEFVRGRIGAAPFAALETLTQKTPRECGNALMTGFLVPFQRWLTGLDPASFKILATYELSTETKADILVKGMGAHLKPLGETTDLRGLPRAKAAAFVAEIGGYCRTIFPVLRASLTPGGSVMVTYLLRAYVMGSVARLLDPHVIPVAASEAGEAGEEGTGLRGLQRAFLACLSRYSVGSRIPSEDEIRLDLEKRAEAEKQKFIKRLDGMTREQRKVELMNKTLGIGEWAVGGTKAIRQYDEDRYEAERTERAQAGLTDYPEAAAAEAAMDSGYDNEQQREDEY